MPFTFAHPAAAVPLQNLLGRHGVLSALVIGSITPDLAYVLPIGVTRLDSHSLAALFWFCPPIGVLTYLLYHWLLKGPLLSLLPPCIADRLGTHAASFRTLPLVSWSAVVVSLLLGATSHLVWDAFTHANGPAVLALPVLRTYLFSIGAYPVHAFKVLQHGSTIIGLLLLFWWSWRWLAAASVVPVKLPVTLTPDQRVLAALFMLGLPVALGVCVGTSAVHMPSTYPTFQVFAGAAVFTTLRAFTAVLLAYSAAWQLRSLRRRSDAHE